MGTVAIRITRLVGAPQGIELQDPPGKGRMGIARGALIETRVANRDDLPLTFKTRHRRIAGLDAQDSARHVIVQFGRSHLLDVPDFIDPGQFGQPLYLHFDPDLIAGWLQFSRIETRGVRHSFPHLLEVNVGMKYNINFPELVAPPGSSAYRQGSQLSGRSAGSLPVKRRRDLESLQIDVGPLDIWKAAQDLQIGRRIVTQVSALRHILHDLNPFSGQLGPLRFVQRRLGLDQDEIGIRRIAAVQAESSHGRHLSLGVQRNPVYRDRCHGVASFWGRLN